MGFFSELGKAFMGQPLGQSAEQDEKAESDDAAKWDAPEEGHRLTDEDGNKIIPRIAFKNLRSQRQGDKQLIVKAWVVNESAYPIRIDTSYLLKQQRQHNQQLGPNDSRELTLYQGEIPDNEHEHEAHIAYRLQANGDVFRENYRVDYHLESDGKRTVDALIDDGPVQDT